MPLNNDDDEAMPDAFPLPSDSWLYDPEYRDPEAAAREVPGRVKCPPGRLAGMLAARKNIEHFVDNYGLGHVGLLTLTFKDPIEIKDAQRALNKAWRRFFSSIFGHRITIVEASRKGRPHFHLVVQVAEDIRAGFGLKEYREYVYENEIAGSIARPKMTMKKRVSMRNAIPANEHLRKIWNALDEGLVGMGFGPVFDFFPVEKNGRAVARYLGKQFAIGFSEKRALKRGTRLVNYSQHCPRAVPSGWRPPSPWWKERHAAFLRATGLDTNQVKDRLGSRWGWRLKSLFEYLALTSEDVWTCGDPGYVARAVMSAILQNAYLQRHFDALIPDLNAMIERFPVIPPPRNLPPPAA